MDSRCVASRVLNSFRRSSVPSSVRMLFTITANSFSCVSRRMSQSASSSRTSAVARSSCITLDRKFICARQQPTTPAFSGFVLGMRCGNAFSDTIVGSTPSTNSILKPVSFEARSSPSLLSVRDGRLIANIFWKPNVEFVTVSC